MLKQLFKRDNLKFQYMFDNNQKNTFVRKMLQIKVLYIWSH